MPRTRNRLTLHHRPHPIENRISSSTMSESRAQKSTQPLQDPLALVSTGASALTVFLIFLVGAAGTLAFLSAQTADPLVLTLMGVLATLGVFFVFGLAAGHIRVSERTHAMDLAAALSERLETGCLLTTQDARVLHVGEERVAVGREASPRQLTVVPRVASEGVEPPVVVVPMTRARGLPRPAEAAAPHRDGAPRPRLDSLESWVEWLTTADPS